MAAGIPFKARSLDCYCIGGFHRTLLQKPRKAGRVINVFEKTINVRTMHDELLVITLDDTKAPVNMNVSAGDGTLSTFSGLTREGQYVVTEHVQDLTVLHAGDVAVSIANPDIFENSLKEPIAGFLHTFAAEIGGILSALATVADKRRGCLLNPDMTTGGLLGLFHVMTGTPTVRKEKHAMARALATLCGRGPGFTPAGDDFIAGYLAAYNWLGRALRLWPPIIPGEEFSRLTTWISFKLMEYSARGLLDAHTQSMFNSVADGNIADFIRRIEIVGRRGHTSGIDFATGAVVGLCGVSDSLFETNTMEFISSILVRKPAQLS